MTVETAPASAVTFALTRPQLRLWLRLATAADASVLNQLGVLEIDGAVDRARFDRALQSVIEGTDALRTVVEGSGLDPRLRVLPELTYRSAFLDLSGTADADDALAAWARQYVDRPLDPAVRPFDSTLVKLSPDRYAWALLQHRLLADAPSLVLVLRRVGDRYARLSPGPVAPAAHYPRFRDRVQLDGAGRLASPSVELEPPQADERPADPPTPMLFHHGRTPSSAADRPRIRSSVRLDADRARALRALAQRDGEHPDGGYLPDDDDPVSDVLAAALFVLLHRITGEPRRSLGVAGRLPGRVAGDVVGPLREEYPLTLAVQDDDTVASLIARVHREAEAARSRLPVAGGRPAGGAEAGHGGVTLDVYTGAPGPFAGAPARLRWYRPGRGEGALLVQARDGDGDGGLTLEFDADAELFTPERLDDTVAGFLRLLADATADPDRPIHTLDVIGQAERRRLDAWNDTGRPYPRTSTVVDLLAEQVARRPHAVAVGCDGRTLTYAQLDARAEGLAARLARLGVRPGTLVGVCLNRSERMLVAILAVLKAGAAYVPLDPSFPAERLAYMLGDAGAAVLLSETALAGLLDAEGCTVLHLDQPAIDEPANDEPAIDEPAIDEPVIDEPAPVRRPGPDDLAYVLYTSGSTGRPKGVEIPHRALTNFLWAMRAEPGFGQDDVMLAHTTVSFDISVLEIFLPLVGGGRVEIVGRAVAADGRRLRERLDRGDITFLQATPVTWRMLLDAGWSGTPGLRTVIGGEPLPPDLIAPLLDRVGELWNMYGPTETTVISSGERVMDPQAPITVGRPIANTTFHVLDRHGRPVPIGVAGELSIGGDGLAVGYRGRPELTAERFVADPFSDVPGARLYRTGDLVRLQEDGRVVHLGRLDSQVKIRGFRIELGEIEAALADQPGVHRAVVDARTPGPAGTALVAYYVAAPGRAPDPEQLRDQLRRTLPDYMVPTFFVRLDEVPLTPNRKVDRKALPDPDVAARITRRDVVEPRTPVERAVAGIWSELLGVERIDVRDDFFDLGGHSLLALRMLDRIQRELGVDLALHQLFVASTVEAVAALVDGPDHLEAVLAIWQDVLGGAAVGPDDDFLAAQGDRDLVDELLRRTREALGVVAEGLSATEFRQRPTPRGLAECLRRNGIPTAGLLVPFRTTGTKTPLFLVHAGGGYVFFYRALAAELDASRPVYGIRAETRRDDRGRPFAEAESLEVVAAQYIEELRRVQPHGPYLLGGACDGGVIAFEMAQQLLAAGEALAGPVIVFDGLLANNACLSPDDLQALREAHLYDESRVAGLRRGVRRRVAAAAALGPVAGAAFLARAAGGRVRWELGKVAARGGRRTSPACDPAAGGVPGPPAGDQLEALAMGETLEASESLVKRYLPQPLTGGVVCFEAADSPHWGRSWNGVATQGTVVHLVGGSHLDMLEHPRVVRTAALVEQALPAT